MMPAPALPTTAVVEKLEEVWGITRQPAGCSHCHQVHLVDPSGVGRICPSCVRGTLQTQPALLRREPPELLIPFQISREEIASILKRYSEAVWIRPDDFKTEILMSRLMPVYFPEWLVDSDIVGTWSAEMGYDYKVKSSQESYRSGGWHTQEVIETRIRWESRMGQIAKRFDNIQVPGLEDHRHLMQVTGGYQTQQPIPYNPDRLGQAYLRVPDLSPESAWPVAQDNLDKAAALSCTQAAGAQHVRNFDLHADYESLNWTQLLLPTYVTYYTDDQGQVHPVYINGQSGAAGGIRLASQRKGWIWAGVLLVSALVLFLSGMLSFAAAALMPPLGVLGTFLVLLGLVVGVASIIPAIWPWRWNREQQAPKVTRT